MDRHIAALGVAAVCLQACSANGTGSDAAQTAHVGRTAPGWSEPSLPGPSISLASLRGKAVYLNFFATWCPPCNEEAPAIDALARAYAGRGLRVVGVDVLENQRKAATFRDHHHLSYPVVIDEGTLRRQYSINGLPVHVFIGRDGVVEKIVVGELSPSAMRSNVEQIVR
jgi:cytochrome c biogenesis protein CcmG/thiol:disulfide interchange protein DsbE